MDESSNIAAILPRMAAERDAQVAMRCPGSRGLGGYARYDSVLTYAQLESRSNAIAAGLRATGLSRGQRVALMVRPTPEFFLLMFALFKLGAVPVLVDPGIPRKALKKCLAESEPEAFIGIPLAQFAKSLLGWAPKGCWPRMPLPERRAYPMMPAPTRSPRSCSPPARPDCPRAWSTAIVIS